VVAFAAVISGSGLLRAAPVSADGGPVAFADAAPQVEEGGAPARIVVNRLDLPVSRLVVSYATEAGTAESGSDFLDTRGSLVFEVGDRSLSFVVPIRDDQAVEPTEHLVLRLVANQTSTTARLTIIDDDRPATPAPSPAGSSTAAPVTGRTATGGAATGGAATATNAAAVAPPVAAPVRRRLVASAPVRRKVVLRQNPVTPFELRPAAPSTSSLPPTEPTDVDPLLALLGGLLLARVAAEVWFRVRAAAAAD
jgi:hypothetical protein